MKVVLLSTILDFNEYQFAVTTTRQNINSVKLTIFGKFIAFTF